jgi:hypothetical protein
MSNLLKLSDYRKQQPKPHEISAHNTVEYMRNEIRNMGGTEQIVQYCQVLIAHLCTWVIKSNFYDKPVEVLKFWVDKKCKDAVRKRNGTDNTGSNQ